MPIRFQSSPLSSCSPKRNDFACGPTNRNVNQTSIASRHFAASTTCVPSGSIVRTARVGPMRIAPGTSHAGCIDPRAARRSFASVPWRAYARKAKCAKNFRPNAKTVVKKDSFATAFVAAHAAWINLRVAQEALYARTAMMALHVNLRAKDSPALKASDASPASWEESAPSACGSTDKTVRLTPVTTGLNVVGRPSRRSLARSGWSA